ncbi:MAG: hypothetical protein DHS20C15_03530 [Planctomycetota bacterium]|nr:MAG: hypothetical protein DHS20C15_03530 [Planctomycetota bacterium]
MIFLLPALLLLSALVSGSETAVFSMRPAERRRLAATRPRLALLMARPGQLLVTLLFANLVLNVAYFSMVASVSLRWQRAGHPVQAAALGLGALLALIVCSEILPKTLALVDPRALVTRLSGFLILLARVLAPAVALSSLATQFLEALLLRSPVRHALRPDDFKSALSGGAALGRYHAVELALLHDVVDFGVRRARTLMVPRVEVAFLDLEASPEQWRAAMAERPFTDYPVIRGGADDLVGTVNTARFLSEPDTPRTQLLEPALLAPQSLEAERLVLRMQDEGRRLAILLDEHGGVAGVLGMAQLMSSILGEVVPDDASGARRRASGGLILSGATALHVLEEQHGLQLPRRRSETLAGAFVEALGRVPVRGDEWRVNGWRLRVLSLRGQRADVLIARPCSLDTENELNEEPC